MGVPDRRICRVCGSELIRGGIPDEATFVCPNCATVDSGPEISPPPTPSFSDSSIPPDTPIAAIETRIVDGTEDSVTYPRETVDFQRQGPVKSPSGTGASGTHGRLTVIGRFVIKKVLGEGAFGTVYRAYDPLLDREVALKVPRFIDTSRAMQERFIREAKSAARLRHPNVVAVFESGHADGHPYIATEFVDGTPLSDVLANTPNLELRRGVEWVRQIADALHYAHQEGVIHRDIKPANIMINAAERPQVMDFGLAKRTADDAAQMTVEGTILGTPAFMSPEQARGEMSRVGPSSDQYSVGVILFSVLCGKMPYEGTAWSIMSRVANLNDGPPKPRSIRPEIPEDLEACCLKAMEKNPVARYENLNDLADDLKRWLEGRPLIARPIGLGERFVRWCRLNRLIASLSGSLAVLLVTATIVGFVLAYRFQDLALAANEETVKANTARAEQAAARSDLERLLVDNYTENGLSAARQKDSRQAVLWFAHAAKLAQNYPLRREHNLVRYSSWLSRAAVPVYAYNAGGYFSKSCRFHPSGRYLLVESLGFECEIHDIENSTRINLPLAHPISGGLWSPDGKHLVLTAYNSVSVFTFPQLEPVRKWAHPELITSISFNGLGNRLAVGSEKGLRVYDFADPDKATPFTELGSRVQAIQFNYRATALAVATEDKRLRVYQLPSDHGVALGEQSLPLTPLATEGTEVLFGFAADDRIVMVDNDRAIVCWDWKQKALAWEKPVGKVICMAVAPDGRRLAYETIETTYKHSAQVLETATGKPLGSKVEHRNHIYHLDWSPDGQSLLACSGDHTASVTEVNSGEPVVAVVPHNGFVLRGAWAPDGRTFATAHWHDRLVRVWRLPGPPKGEYVTQPENDQAFIKLTSDGRAMIMAGFDTRRTQREIQVYQTLTGHPVGAVIRPAGAINDALYLPVKKMLVTAGSLSFQTGDEVVSGKPLRSPGTVQFWDQLTGQPTHAALPTAAEPVAMALAPGESTIALLCDDGTLKLLDAQSGLVRSEHIAFKDAAADKGFVIRDRIRFSPDGQRFAIWGWGGAVQLRNSVTGELERSVAHQAAQTFVHDVRFSPSGAELVTCSSDNTVMCWEVLTGKPVATLQHTGWVFNAQFSQAGDRLLTASSDRQARLWDWKTKTVIVSTMEQQDQVYGVAFAPGENIFVTGSRDGTLGAWETATGKQVAPLRNFDKMLYQVESDARTGMLLTAGRLKGIAGLPLRDWLNPPDFQLPDADLLLLAEIISNQKILETSVAANLTTSEWFARWTSFQSKYPRHPVFRIQLERPVGNIAAAPASHRAPSKSLEQPKLTTDKSR